MSDTVKIVIEIPRDEYKDIKDHEQMIRTYPTTSLIRILNGKPLSDALNEIKEEIDNLDMEYDCNTYCGGISDALKIINKHISEAESKDSNDLTHMFDGVTEIPKDVFKGWATEELLGQTRAEREGKE